MSALSLARAHSNLNFLILRTSGTRQLSQESTIRSDRRDPYGHEGLGERVKSKLSLARAEDNLNVLAMWTSGTRKLIKISTPQTGLIRIF